MRRCPLATPGTDDEMPGRWWELALTPQQRVVARFALLLMLGAPVRAMAVGEVAARLGQAVEEVSVVVALHAAAGC